MNTMRIFALALSFAVAACGEGRADLVQTGDDPALPEPSNRLIPAMNIALPAGWDGEMPTAPAGFRVTALASNLKIPRQTLVLPNGDILVAEGAGGHASKVRPKDVIAGFVKKQGVTTVKGGDRITLLRDQDGDGRTDLQTVFIDKLDAPYGLALIGNDLYVANQGSLLRFPYREGATSIDAPGEEVTPLPEKINHHWTKSMAASQDGSRLYVGIGSNSNVGERGMAVEENRAVVWEIDPASGAHRILASGLRNPTALAINPWTNGLWAVVNERDELGAHLVPDYLTSVRDGAFYGWPYSYWGQNVDPRIRPQKPELVRKAIVPDYSLGSHVAPLGLSFATDGGMGGNFSEGAFVGMHGSWNRPKLAGYKVVFVPFRNGRPAGKPIDFLTGFIDDGNARGRPVGVTYDPQRRALLVSDDLSNTVWRIGPVGGGSNAPAAQRSDTD